MSDLLTSLAAMLAKQGAPVIGGMIGTAIGGPAGAAVGGLAGKAIEALAEAFGVHASPEAVTDAIIKNENSPSVVRQVEEQAATMLPLWQAQLAMAQQAQTAELEKGFSSWNARRNFAHYTAWGLTLSCGFAALVLAAMDKPSASAVAALFSSSIGLTMAWLAVNSGGKAVTDIAREWKSDGFKR